MWEDEEDASILIASRKNAKLARLSKDVSNSPVEGKQLTTHLESKHEALYSKPKWALQDPISRSEDSDPLRIESVARLSCLPPDVLDLSRLADANFQARVKIPVISAIFHPQTSVMIVANRDSSVNFFSLDHKENSIIHSLKIGNSPIKKLELSSDGLYFAAIGKSRFIHVYDMLNDRMESIDCIAERSEKEWSDILCSPTNSVYAALGTEGFVALFSMSTKRSLGQFKMNCEVKAACFTSDGKLLITAGSDRFIYVWDVEKLKCIKKFADNGGTDITSIGLSPKDVYLVIGTAMGVVNLYDFRKSTEITNDNPQPWKTILNLTTVITSCVWHPSGELLALTSDAVNNGLRLLHLPSGRVYSNFPNNAMPLGLVKTARFNNDGSYFAIGCADGKVRLFAIKHFMR